MSFEGLKVALVHDWLPVIGGAERVLEQFTKIFPRADIFTLFCFLSDEEKKIFGDCSITPSYLNRLPKVSKYYRKLLSFYPEAIESFDLSGYDLVLSSSSSAAKGVITTAQQTHVAYVHSPARYAWDLTHDYLRQTNMDKGLTGSIARHMLHHFRNWDARTANGVDHFLANSGYIAKRVWKTYRREANVVHPCADITAFEYQAEKDDFYLTASRMVPYKRIDLVVEAFTKMPDKKLVVIGDGPEMKKIADIVEGHSNIDLRGFQSRPKMIEAMQKARAFVFAAEEDFGIVPVEAQACGTPVIAYGQGGATETVIDFSSDLKNATGVYFDTQTIPALTAAVEEFERNKGQIDPKSCRANAEKFSPEIFRENIAREIKSAMGMS